MADRQWAGVVDPAAADDAAADDAPPDTAPAADPVARAVAAFARALRLSCLAARHPAHAGLANRAVAAHRAARAWAEAAVERAAAAAPARGDAAAP